MNAETADRAARATRPTAWLAVGDIADSRTYERHRPAYRAAVRAMRDRRRVPHPAYRESADLGPVTRDELADDLRGISMMFSDLPLEDVNGR